MGTRFSCFCILLGLGADFTSKREKSGSDTKVECLWGQGKSRMRYMVNSNSLQPLRQAFHACSNQTNKGEVHEVSMSSSLEVSPSLSP